MMRIILTVVALVAASPAAAQSALKNHNADAPIDIDAATFSGDDAAGRATWSGDVRVIQGKMTLTADTVTALYTRSKKGGDPQIDRIDAQNNVKLVTPSETASGRTGIYDTVRRTITLIGGVTLTHGDSVLRGQRLAIDLDSGKSRLDGANTGPATPGAAPTSGRVSGRFVVPPRQTSN